MNNVIYFDNAATSKVDEEVLAIYDKVSSTLFANASSIHSLGYYNNELVEKARSSILHDLKLNDKELIFTSGATEANNLAIKGYAFKYQNRGKHIIVSSIEHPSVLESVKQLEELFGFSVTYLPVNEKGVVDVLTLKEKIRDDTILVSVMAVNNETGMIQPIEEIATLLHSYPKIAFHVDAVQAIGKVNIDFSNVSLLTLTAHKIHGPKGVGALIKNKNISLIPLNSGGGQEKNNRSGTYDVPSIMAFAKAVNKIKRNEEENRKYVKLLAEDFLSYCKNHPDLYQINSDIEKNPYIVNISLKEKKAAVVVEGLSRNGIMISSVSACHSKREAISHVVYEMYHNEQLAHNTLRISFSTSNKLSEVDFLVQKLDEIVKGIK